MALKDFAFKLLKKDKSARLGIIETHRGNILTPAFMPVGTQATVKACTIDDIKKTGSQIILSNTYHLMIRPGVERIISAGGLHQFMNCDLPILTDSGGFQVMSLSKLNKIDREKGAIFNSHVDGKKFYLSPEESIRIQLGLNSDIVMIMDECPKKTTDYDVIKKSMDLSLYWAERSKKAFGINPQKALFGIIQGGLFKDLRISSLKGLENIGFDGYALGGLAVGETQQEMFDVLDNIKDYLPINKPHYLMGVGTPSDILGAVKRGIDMFDCVLPTRSGRTGLAFTWEGRINIKNNKYQTDNSPLDPNCNNLNLNKYSKNYLNHLFNTNEILASMLLTLHNINFYQELMSSIRDHIKNGTFNEFHDKYVAIL
ncbi:MAG: queuine tRNA-ribosyltransferase [Pelagibacteraceae bacterium BACL5 MAG-120705-bin12]|jgi:queuine tRNA-ribosyltransferase|uniref:tRNA guanosine(34) transglycosylase Tgt n=1 Tax=Candidatus Pelagibacter sp. TaxID=2024849 RepID=UPI00071590AE|nr:MAG: queuine tRNA-ribosyltransferase [Pelagibacteraceae bacterium BACL5 MAG-120705-bin12]KRO75089.1 MAG: queuine tRNA-ribosyltransferase [Pelagibacteraceae bacterium BACL5 MAG-120813-bin20]